MDLVEVLRAHLELPKMILPHKIDYAKVGPRGTDAAVSYDLGHLMVAKGSWEACKGRCAGACVAAHRLITASAGLQQFVPAGCKAA